MALGIWIFKHMKKTKIRVADVFCKAGGASWGYALALGSKYSKYEWEIVGVDKFPQKNYPFKFIQQDAIEFLQDNWKKYDFFHTSPPCQKNSVMTKGLWKDRLDSHPELISPTRDILVSVGKPYVIENVPTAPLRNPVILCGSMFGLKVRKHRLFESNFHIDQPECRHKEQGKVVAVYGHSGGSSKRDGIKFGGVDTWKEAMGIHWMTGAEMAEAIPPLYTEYVGKFIPF